MLLFIKFNHVNVIRTHDMKISWEIFSLCLCYVCSYKPTTHNEIINVTGNVFQLKIEFYRQILILLKPSLIHAHLRSDAMAI